jgi:hypothetical protein
MTYIDAALLNLVELCCRKFQMLTGRTNVWLAIQLTNLSIVVYFLWAVLYFLIADFQSRVFVALFCTGLLYLLTQTVFKDSIELHETNAYRRVAKGYRNPRRVRDALLRTSFLFLSFALSYPALVMYFTFHVQLVLLPYSLVILTTVVLYLLACDPLPPCASKLKAWLQRTAAIAEVPKGVSDRRGDCSPL